MIQTELFPGVQTYVTQRITEFEEISDARKSQLRKIAAYVGARAQAGQSAKLTFICTHNSRRSHMAQIWAAVAAAYYQIVGVDTYSGGTEATAFNPRSVATMERAGLQVTKAVDGKNPRYEVRFQQAGTPLICFSKVYAAAPNPQTDYCAVMTCSEADAGCPIVVGASLRVATPYEDPKVADDTPDEAPRYDARCRQICREMFYLFSQVEAPRAL